MEIIRYAPIEMRGRYYQVERESLRAPFSQEPSSTYYTIGRLLARSNVRLCYVMRVAADAQADAGMESSGQERSLLGQQMNGDAMKRNVANGKREDIFQIHRRKLISFVCIALH